MNNQEKIEVQIYHYSPKNGVYIGTVLYVLPHGVGIPANATTVEPPICGADEVAVYKNGSWTVHENHVGKTFFRIPSGESITIAEIGPLPDDLTDVPPGDFEKWDETSHSWVADQQRILLNEISLLESQQTPRRIREAINGSDGGWLSDLEVNISNLRNQLADLS